MKKMRPIETGTGPRWLVVDVDETLVNSLRRTWEQLNKIATQVYGAEAKRLPSYVAFCQQGPKVYKPTLGENFFFLQDQMIQSRKFNATMEPVPGAQEAMAALAPHVLFYLTARPRHLRDVTHADLQRNNFPNRPVIASPNEFNPPPVWKISVLNDLAWHHEATMVIIDNSFALHRAIHSFDLPAVKSRLFKGPNTPNHPDAMTWPEIVEDLLR